jgi:hypothetical protein
MDTGPLSILWAASAIQYAYITTRPVAFAVQKYLFAIASKLACERKIILGFFLLIFFAERNFDYIVYFAHVFDKIYIDI